MPLIPTSLCVTQSLIFFPTPVLRFVGCIFLNSPKATHSLKILGEDISKIGMIRIMDGVWEVFLSTCLAFGQQGCKKLIRPLYPIS